MTFYEAMQLGTSTLKPIIKKEEDEKIKRKYTYALIAKAIACVIFCVFFVTAFTKVFGSESSIAAVVTVIALLNFRFSSLDFKIGQAAIALIGIFISYIYLPHLAASVGPIPAAFINFVAILCLTMTTCHNVMYSNQSIIVLCYLLLFGNEITSREAFYSRSFALLFGGLLVAGIFYFKNRKGKSDNTFLDVLKDFKLSDSRTRWQIKLALGISTGMLIGELLNIPRVMWIGFACMSILNHNPEKVKERAIKRPIFMILGCVIFFIIYTITPADFKMLVGLLGGVCVGLAATYEWQTVFNTFGAVSVAVPIFGLGGAIALRLVANIFGAIYSNLFNYAFNKVEKNLLEEKKAVNC